MLPLKRPSEPSSPEQDAWSACVARDVATHAQQDYSRSCKKRSRHKRSRHKRSRVTKAPSASTSPRPHHKPPQRTEAPSESTSPQSHTIFIPNLPQKLKSHPALRSLFPHPPSTIHFASWNNHPIAWVCFSSASITQEAVDHLNTIEPSLAARIEVPKSQTVNPSPPPSPLPPNPQDPGSQFDKRLRVVCANGGIGNTLIFRNLPLPVTVPEFTNLVTIRNHTRNVSHDPNPSLVCTTSEHPLIPIRVRTAVSRAGSSRAFWTVFSNVHQARLAFVATFRNKVSLRCGSVVTLHPIVHDDSTDVDETKRRQRALQLQPDRRNSQISQALTPHPQSACRALEAFLTSTQTSFAFLTHCHTPQRPTGRTELNVASAQLPPSQPLR